MFDGPAPIYLQIADRIRTEILNGSLREEEQVMSTTQYATTYRINPATAAKAFAQLVDEQILYKRRGVGMFVSPDARTRLLSERRERFFADVVDPVLDEARMLGIPVADVIARLDALDSAPSPTGSVPPDASPKETAP